MTNEIPQKQILSAACVAVARALAYGKELIVTASNARGACKARRILDDQSIMWILYLGIREQKNLALTFVHGDAIVCIGIATKPEFAHATHARAHDFSWKARWSPWLVTYRQVSCAIFA